MLVELIKKNSESTGELQVESKQVEKALFEFQIDQANEVSKNTNLNGSSENSPIEIKKNRESESAAQIRASVNKLIDKTKLKNGKSPKKIKKKRNRRQSEFMQDKDLLDSRSSMESANSLSSNEDPGTKKA